MAPKRSKPARGNGSGLGILLSSAERNPEHSKPLPQFQAAFLASRFRLDPDRARLTAELAFGDAR